MNNFRGGFGGGNMQNLLKQAQKMQEEMVKKQQELEESVVEASVANGLVTLKMNGKKEVVDLKIKREAVDPDDIEMLEDLIKAVINDASNQIEELKEKTLGTNLNLGGLF